MNPDTAMKVRKLLVLAGISSFDGEALNSLRAAVSAVEKSGQKWTTWVEALKFRGVGDSFIHEQTKQAQGPYYRENMFESMYRKHYGGEWKSQRSGFSWFDGDDFFGNTFDGATWTKEPPKPPPEPSRKDEEKIARWEAESQKSSSKRFFKGF